MRNFILFFSMVFIFCSISFGDVITKRGELNLNGNVSSFTITFEGVGLEACWNSGGTRSCDVYLTGSWNGRKLTNSSNSGSTFTEHELSSNGHDSMTLKMVNCGPYVGACEYSWIGRYNSQSKAFEGPISFYPGHYGFMKIYAN